jgi:hypothetical protein
VNWIVIRQKTANYFAKYAKNLDTSLRTAKKPINSAKSVARMDIYLKTANCHVKSAKNPDTILRTAYSSKIAKSKVIAPKNARNLTL